MAKLIYSAIASLDGFVADERGAFDWSAPDEQVHRFVNDLEREVGTYLYGRRMYEVMRFWDDPNVAVGEPEVFRDYAAIWRAADKVVYSSTLGEVSTARTRLERAFDPEAVRAMKRAAERDISIGGPTLAGQALAAGLVEECHVFLTPVIVGGGLPLWPLGVRLPVSLADVRSFDCGVVHLHYRVSS